MFSLTKDRSSEEQKYWRRGLRIKTSLRADKEETRRLFSPSPTFPTTDLLETATSIYWQLIQTNYVNKQDDDSVFGWHMKNKLLCTKLSVKSDMRGEPGIPFLSPWRYLLSPLRWEVDQIKPLRHKSEEISGLGIGCAWERLLVARGSVLRANCFTFVGKKRGLMKEYGEPTTQG